METLINIHVSVPATIRDFSFLSAMYLNEMFSDLKFEIAGEVLPAHKAIVGNKSQYFASLIENADGRAIQVEDTDSVTFQAFLKYFYTGKFVLDIPDQKRYFEVMGLAQKYLLDDLLDLIVADLDRLVDFPLVMDALNTAILCGINKLQEYCCVFLENNAKKFIAEADITQLCQDAMVALLQRDTLVVPEVKIFEQVMKWREVHEDKLNGVLECVRFSDMDVEELVRIVEPTNLVPAQKLFDVILERTKREGPATRRFKINMVPNFELNTKQFRVKYIAGEPVTTDAKNTAYQCAIEDKNGVGLELNSTYLINNIKFSFPENPRDQHVYGYYIETSVDKDEWIKIIDYSKYHCHAKQDLYFEDVVVKYIRIVGAFTLNKQELLRINKLSIYYNTREGKENVNGITKPGPKTPLYDLRPILNTGHLSSSAELSSTYDTPRIIGIELDQPYWVSRLTFTHTSNVPYTITTSIDRESWHAVIDQAKDKSADFLPAQEYKDCCVDFPARAVLFIRIQFSQTPPKGIAIFQSFCLS